MADLYSGKDNFVPTQAAVVSQKQNTASVNTNYKNKKPAVPAFKTS